MRSEKYSFLLPKDFRFLIRWILPSLVIILIIFIVAFLKPLFEGTHNIIPNVIASICFACFGLMLLSFCRDSYDATLLCYSINNNRVLMKGNNTEYSIDMDQEFFLSVLPVAFSAKGASWYEQFYIVSNSPLPEFEHIKSGGLYLITEVSRENIAILPVNKETQAWVAQTTCLVHIPEYPKVAYFQKRMHQ